MEDLMLLTLSIEQRAKLIRRLDKYLLKNVSDEELLDSWFSVGVPDCASDTDYTSIAEDNSYMLNCLYLFAKILLADQ